MAKPILYGPAFSTFVRSARLVLAEKGVDYDLVEVDIFAGVDDAYRERQPWGKVPAFEHDGLKLYETVAIARYVDEAFPGPALQPASAAERARMTQVMSIVDSYTYGPVVGQVVIQRLVVPMTGGTTDEAAVAAALPAARLSLGTLDALLGDGEYLAGSTLSLADLHLLPIVEYFALTPEGEALLPTLPRLEAWCGRLGSRDSAEATRPELG
jgi:glutathione S-transferase